MTRIFVDGDLEKRINAATSAAEIAELLHLKGVQDGVLRRADDGSFVPVTPDPRVEPVREYTKIIFVENQRLLLTANSPEKLDALEAIAKKGYAK